MLVTTSGVAYGAFPDNPVPLTEDDPVRGVAGFTYARDKTESDRLCQLWAATHPERVMTIVRPCIVFGPNVDNYLVRLWTKQPFAVDVGTIDSDIQFVHEDDVVEGITGLLLGRHGGAYNVAGDGLMTNRECAELIGTPIRKMPLRLYRGLARVMWKLRQSEVPPGRDRVRAPLLAALEREAQANDRLGAEAHEPRDLRDHDAGAREAAAGGDRRDRVSRCYAGRLKHSQGR